jgi:hypothetical protein
MPFIVTPPRKPPRKTRAQLTDELRKKKVSIQVYNHHMDSQKRTVLRILDALPNAEVIHNWRDLFRSTRQLIWLQPEYDAMRRELRELRRKLGHESYDSDEDDNNDGPQYVKTTMKMYLDRQLHPDEMNIGLSADPNMEIALQLFTEIAYNGSSIASSIANANRGGINMHDVIHDDYKFNRGQQKEAWALLHAMELQDMVLDLGDAHYIPIVGPEAMSAG